MDGFTICLFWFAGGCGVVAVVGAILAVRHRPAQSGDAPGKRATPKRQHLASHGPTPGPVFYGGEPPSAKQVAYAKRLGIEIDPRMGKEDVSEAITRALKRGKPATKEQMRRLKSMKAQLPRDPDQAEADEVIEMLEDYDFECPGCACSCLPEDKKCDGCGRSLADVKIPIDLP